MEPFNAFNSPEFRSEMGALLDEKLKPVFEFQDKITIKVNEHDQAINRSRGALWTLGGLWGLLLSLLSGHIWFGKHP